MPHYTFRNKDTGEEFDLEMKISEREPFLEANPELIQVFNKINYADSVTIGVTKPPSDFTKYVLGRVKETNPHGDAVERRHTIPREW